MICNFILGQEKSLYNLIKTTFDEYVGHEYSSEGNQTFYDFIKPSQFLERHKRGSLILIYKHNEIIIGMIEVRDSNHISLFFVEKSFQNRGIGKELFLAAKQKIEGKTTYIDVNASPNSVIIYSKLGFSATDNILENGGIKYVPMRINL